MFDSTLGFPGEGPEFGSEPTDIKKFAGLCIATINVTSLGPLKKAFRTERSDDLDSFMFQETHVLEAGVASFSDIALKCGFHSFWVPAISTCERGTSGGVGLAWKNIWPSR